MGIFTVAPEGGRGYLSWFRLSVRPRVCPSHCLSVCLSVCPNLLHPQLLVYHSEIFTQGLKSKWLVLPLFKVAELSDARLSSVVHQLFMYLRICFITFLKNFLAFSLEWNGARFRTRDSYVVPMWAYLAFGTTWTTLGPEPVPNMKWIRISETMHRRSKRSLISNLGHVIQAWGT